MIPITTTIIFFAIALLLITYSYGDNDMQCLFNFQSSVSDPDNHLSWSFLTDHSTGYVCNFTGVTCWHPDQIQIRVRALSLSSLNLSGYDPSMIGVLSSLRLCSSLTTLDLSNNFFSGFIPSSLCAWLPNLVTLNLSSNRLTGPIPSNLSDCTYLTNLDLSNNNLSGQIPVELSMFDASSFDKNHFLCGYPISSGCSFIKTSHIILTFFSFGFSGFIFSVSISYVVWSFCIATKTDTRKKEQVLQLTSPLNDRPIVVRLSKNPIEKLTLRDLMIATKDFHPETIVVAGSSSTGTSYEAVLPDGSGLTVKRLSECGLSGRQFRTEMGWIKQIRHPNLVPLLGFCTLMEDKFLMYETMFNGALSLLLQSRDEILDWERRLKIGIGVARGLAWLHHRFQVPLLHRNLCSSAVLLNEYYEPRIADFGLVGLFRPSVVDDGANICSSSNAAADYACSPSQSTKEDVYDLGVVLLELATGQCVLDVDSDNLVHWVMHELSVGICEAIDKSLRGKGNDNDIVEFLKIACGCVVDRPHERPSAIEVYESLKRIGVEHEILEDCEDSSLICGNENSEVAEFVKLAYCIYTGTDPFM